jgi:hypothetical protein
MARPVRPGVNLGRALRHGGPALTYHVAVAARKKHDSAAATAEAVRVRRLREDAQRPISVNLAETIALSHALIKMADAARRR